MKGHPWKTKAKRRSLTVDHLCRLAAVQGRVCPICGAKLPPVGGYCQPGDRATFDHVWPRRPLMVRDQRIAAARRVGDLGNVVAAHSRCNATKANRWPTGCELVWLAAVNARLELAPAEGCAA